MYKNIIGQSTEIKELIKLINKIASTSANVLIQGESGTGKELIAQNLHYLSDKKDKPFIAINCGAIPANLIESELFGHVKGAFTDATQDKKGLISAAEGGTLFLDEVVDLPLETQSKLLRFLQEGEIKPVGSEETLKVNVRVISAAAKKLENAVKEKSFREDLYYRLNVLFVQVPPLRKRKDDISLLCEFFLKKMDAKHQLGQLKISTGAMKILQEYSWPGNVRELENCIERSAILCDEGIIVQADLPESIFIQAIKDRTETLDLDVSEDSALKTLLEIRPFKKAVQNFEKIYIREALNKNFGHREETAKELSVSLRNLQYKIKQFKMNNKN